jgi:hypothetical protein
MQSHNDQDALPANFWNRLETRAERMMAKGESQITAGAPGEPVLKEWRHRTMCIVQRPDDEQNILRISVGGGVVGADISYCVFRGDRTQCANLLEQAAVALREGP